MPFKPDIFVLESEEALEIHRQLAVLPKVDFKSQSIKQEEYWSQIDKAKQFQFSKVLVKRAQTELFDVNGNGYIIVDGLFPYPDEDINQKLKLPTAVCGILGRPLKVMDKLGLWLDVPVKLNVQPFRFGGVGYNPLHIDVVNATNPPDMVVLLSERPDPLGGGESVVANMRNALCKLSAEEINLLEESVYRDGQLNNMSNVGEEYNPFPVLKGKNKEEKIRYTAKMLYSMNEGPHRRVIEKLLQLLVEIQETVMLKPGQAIIMNQAIVAHGRLPLGQEQGKIEPQRRRLLHQLYLRCYSGNLF
jgi:Taurine catabolism dioxygenase TauD, TfdA family